MQVSRSASPVPARHALGPALGVIAVLAIAWGDAASAAPTLGFVENWPGTSIQGWGSIQMTFVNPGTGGAGGDGDGYLRMSRVTRGNFGTRSTGQEYVGNWTAAGITQVRLWLNDVDTDQAFEIRFAIGTFSNLWQYDPGFVPPENEWGLFVVDLTDSTAFSHIIGGSNLFFASALQDVQVIHLRHDKPPFMQMPDSIAGDLGLDRLLLTDGVVGVPLADDMGRAPVPLAPPRPNPSRGPVALTATATQAEPIELTIVDAAGRVVRRTQLAPGAGPRVWIWDGRDGSGRIVPAGSYRVRAVGSGGGTSRSLVRVR